MSLVHVDTPMLTPGGHGVVFRTRNGTNDANIAISINGWQGQLHDEYRMAGRELAGWAIDVGAHIGALTIPLALDHPNLRVLAIEGVPENAALITENALRNGVADRVTVVNAWAAAPGTKTGVCHYGYRKVDDVSQGYVDAHRFIGGTWGAHGEAGSPEVALELPAISLDEVLGRFGIHEVALLKLDCEGCEWQFLDTTAVSQVQTIVGEYHGRPAAVSPVVRLRELLGATHDVDPWNETMIDMGLFEATRR